MKPYFLVLLFTVILFSCDSKKQVVQGETEYQKTMNANFKDATTSPLKDKDREQFQALDFFKVDSNYVVIARLIRTPENEYFDMETTTSRIARERVYGVLEFSLKGESHQLSVYQGEESLEEEAEARLFLPFLDETNGESTYAGGRYIDLQMPAGNKVVVDFNKAYNPYCAYNEKYSCPIVPIKNALKTKIEVGVKAFKKSTK